MKIDLRAYGLELAYWIEAFKPFVDPASHLVLDRLHSELENGHDRLRPSFEWKLATPIVTKVADRYDGVQNSPHKVRISWRFRSRLQILPTSRKDNVWSLTDMVTQMKVFCADTDAEILHFHHDMKSEGQLGPHSHMQFSEHYLKDNNRIPIAVPRFPSLVMLPTDCLDFVLSEFFPFEWPRAQSSSRGLTSLRSAQERRLLAMSAALLKEWKGESRKTPIAAIQNCYLPDLQIA